MRRRGDPINKLGQVESINYLVMIVLMKYTVRQLLRKVKSCITLRLDKIGWASASKGGSATPIMGL